MIEEERYGIDRQYAHPRALELIPDEFFWDSVDELAPFGSDQGDEALAEYRTWRADNPGTSIYEFVKAIVEQVGEMDVKEYSPKLVNRKAVETLIEDEHDQQYVFSLDAAVIATGFGQLVDEGNIDDKIKPLIKVAIDRQILWAKIQREFGMWDRETSEEYVNRLNILKRVLDKA